ncbi:hypothetical protein L596_012697 [Steinernema carpocapsae]|uniref:Uncharacterized protein n=1 Tax=Steinernema carpocapsae TaxID=34508 RepID=A0A4U5NYR1_STECR|nr:hypothetical protein L596_012697 [Steinernema carpocapsae]
MSRATLQFVIRRIEIDVFAIRCNLCALNTKRRALDQIERQLRNSNQSPEKQSKLVVEDRVPVVEGPPKPRRISRSPSPVTAMKLAATCLPPIVKPPRTIFSASSQMPIYCVTLPATISKKALKRSVKRIEEQNKKTRLLEEAETKPASPSDHRSIFHSVEELARSG